MNKKELKTNLKQKIDEVFDRVEKLEQKKDHLNDQLKNSYKTQIADLNRRKKDLQKVNNLLQEVILISSKDELIFEAKLLMEFVEEYS